MNRTTRLALRLVAARQDIVNMGFPEIISKFLYEKYGKLAPLVAKWYKQYRAPGSYAEDPNWWRRVSDYSGGLSISDLTYLYEAATDPKSYAKAAQWAGIELRAEGISQEEVNEERLLLLHRIKDKLSQDLFFSYSSLMQDINSGKLTDVAPYKKLKYHDAEIKYDERRHFAETTPLKVYDNGFKWVDTGKRSVVLSTQMKNCGSVGVMSMDKDRTILALFGPTNKPHVMVTYSPNEQRISGDECAGSSPVKPEYHDYVLDLAHSLGAYFDAQRSKSPELRVKYLLRNKAQSIEQLSTRDEHSFESYFRFVADGQEFYTNGDIVVPGADVDRVEQMLESGELKLRYPQKEAFKTVLTQANQSALIDHGVTFIPMYAFSEE